MNKSKTLAKNTAILGLGKLSAQFIGFLLLPLYTLHLQPDEYGFVDLMVTYIHLLVPAVTLQLEMASFRYLVDAREDEQNKTRVISNVTLLTLQLITPWILIFIASAHYFDIPHSWLILLAGVSLLYLNTTLQMTRGLGDNKRFAIGSMIVGVSTLLGALLFVVYLGMKVDGMLLSIALANTAGALYVTLSMQLYKYVKIGEWDTILQRNIMGYSTPLVPNGIAWWVINASDRTIIAAMIDTAANGVYAVSTKYSAILNGLFGVFSMSWTESASMYINEPDRDQFFSKVANSAVRLFGALGLGLIATIPFIFPLMVDDSFKEAYLYIPIMIIGVFFNVIVGIYSAIYIAKKLTRQVMNTSLVAAALNIVLAVGLIPFFGLYAAAASTAVAFLAMAIYRHYDVKKYVKITYEKNVFIILFILYVIVMYLYYMESLWADVIGLAIASISAYLINKKEIKKIYQMTAGKLRSEHSRSKI